MQRPEALESSKYKFIYIAEFLAKCFFSDEYFPKLSDGQMERLDGKIEFIVKSGHYKGFAAQAFNIWYDITKLHILHNGNKRMAFACFILYCNKNGKKPKGSIKNFKEISLYIAESKSDEKERVIHELRQRIAFIDIK